MLIGLSAEQLLDISRNGSVKNSNWQTGDQGDHLACWMWIKIVILIFSTRATLSSLSGQIWWLAAIKVTVRIPPDR